MRLNKSQILSILIFTIFFVILYFGCDTKSTEQNALVKTREQNLEILNIDRIIHESKNELSPSALVVLGGLEDSLQNTTADSSRIKMLESIASFWYQAQIPLASAHYARLIAEELEADEQAWAICGTSFAIASKRLENEDQINFAVQNSRKAFENAASLNSEELDHIINLALSYVDFPLENNPMKGILMLVDLNKKHPDNVSVLMQLGRLSIQTNQLDKAIQRLTKVLELNPDIKQAHCLLAQVYDKLGDTEKAEKEIIFCNSQ